MSVEDLVNARLAEIRAKVVPPPPPEPHVVPRRYVLFAWEPYEAHGGLHDMIGSFDSLKEAQDFYVDPHGGSLDREVVDRDTWEVVWRKQAASGV